MGVRVANNRRPFTSPPLHSKSFRDAIRNSICILYLGLFFAEFLFFALVCPRIRFDAWIPDFQRLILGFHCIILVLVLLTKDRDQIHEWILRERNTARCRSLLHFFNGWFPKMLEFVIWNTFEALPLCMCECMWGNIHYIVTKAPITSTTTGIQAWSNFATFLFGVYLKKHPSEEENKCLMKLFQKKRGGNV